ncbi:MAG: 50S ribosomal protein L29 [Desulfovibrio sp.]|jgi:large subunit ribosomal protein L29|nr:50S ribosomal protein L29 [Desulfovibrio sp.]
MAATKSAKKTSFPSVQDLRALSVEELNAKLLEQREALMNARFKHATAQLERTSDLKAMRRQIARMETILTEKQQRA